MSWVSSFLQVEKVVLSEMCPSRSMSAESLQMRWHIKEVTVEKN
jgi:hypothetical protein